ncbi:MAG: MFS transporter, partial [Myxococcota bacterium]
IGAWSIATALHALGRGVISLSVYRSLLGVAEAGNWPGAAKGNAEWFPVHERALAQGIFNSGAAIGGLVSIPIIGLMAISLSWQTIFVVVGLLGLLWLVPWLIVVKAPPSQHPWVSREERDYILHGKSEVSPEEPAEGYSPGTLEMLSRKQSWGVIIASAAIDPIWWLFIFWIPTYLTEVFDMDVKGIAIYGWVPYVGAMLGAWFGGLLSQSLFSKGWGTDRTRKFVITLGCGLMLPALLAMSSPGSPTVAVLIMAVILFGFQTAIGSVQTLPSDMFGKKSVGTLAGLAGMAAKLTAWGLTVFVPWLTRDSNYAPAFVLGASLALTTAAAVWLLCPKIEPLTPSR